MNFVVRSAFRADVPDMHRVRNSVRENRLSDHQQVSERSYLPYIEAGTAWVVEQGGDSVGFAALDASAGSVWALFVDPDAEGQGIGRALHAAIVQAARDLHIEELSLSTSEGTRAKRFYESAGWQCAGVTTEGELIFRLRTDAGTAVLHSSVSRLWNMYRQANPNAPADVPVSFHFCDNPEDADLCAALVIAGRKRATATSLAELELSKAPVPRAGDYAVVTNWAGEAKAIIRTTSLEIKRFEDVDVGFAAAEGEGDGTLNWWRSAHRAYYQRALAGSSWVVDDNLEIACERFEVMMTT